MTRKTIELIGVPLDLGAQNLGVAGGPLAYQQNDIAQKLLSSGFDVNDGGTIEVTSRDQLVNNNHSMRYADEIVRVSNEIYKRVYSSLKGNRAPVVLGGDHSVDLGAFSGASDFYEGNIGMIYIDAHGDMNTPDTSLTGNIHGMHLASLMGWGPDSFKHIGSQKTKLQKEHLLHIGGSDLDEAEVELIKRESLNSYSLLDMMAYGLGPLLEKIKALAQKTPHMWVSLDLDAIDKMYAPAAAMPNSGGITYREISAICQYIGANCNVVGVDVVELNPDMDEENKTNELAIEMIAKLLGKNYNWYTNYMAKNHR